jgi:DNA-binding NtrC family response regulator
MSEPEYITTTAVEKRLHIGPPLPIPGLLVAYSPSGVSTIDRCRVTLPSFSVGRLSKNNLLLHDNRVSGIHFRIFISPDGFMIEDANSTNGTFVNGTQISEPTPLSKGTVIRAGRNVLVFEPNAASMLAPPPVSRYDMVGPFYVTSIIDMLKEAVHDGRHILIAGQTGVGKELAARAIAAMMRASDRAIPIVEHNCAQYASEDEANTSLFGVGNRVFSEVDSRCGFIEQAGNGLLFLDEANVLPPRVQKSLLRLIEDREYRRIGESKVRMTNARILLASNNVDSPTAGLIHDLYPRLCVVRIPSLQERIADIPSIFCKILRKSLDDVSVNENYYSDSLAGEHYELLCLAGLAETNCLPDNVRGVRDVAKRLAAKAANGKEPEEALNEVFYERFSSITEYPLKISTKPHGYLSHCRETEPPSPSSSEMNASSSHYEKHKELIIKIYNDKEKRVAPTVRALKKLGIPCTRQHLSKYLKKWGVRD